MPSRPRPTSTTSHDPLPLRPPPTCRNLYSARCRPSRRCPFSMASWLGVAPVASAAVSASSAPPCAVAGRRGGAACEGLLWSLLHGVTQQQQAAAAGGRGRRPALAASPAPRACSSTVHASVWPRMAAQCSGVQPSLSARPHRPPSTSSRRSVSARHGRAGAGGDVGAEQRRQQARRQQHHAAQQHTCARLGGDSARGPPAVDHPGTRSQPPPTPPTRKALVGRPVQRAAPVRVQAVGVGGPLEGQVVQRARLAVLRSHVAHGVAAAGRWGRGAAPVGKAQGPGRLSVCVNWSRQRCHAWPELQLRLAPLQQLQHPWGAHNQPAAGA